MRTRTSRELEPDASKDCVAVNRAPDASVPFPDASRQVAPPSSEYEIRLPERSAPAPVRVANPAPDPEASSFKLMVWPEPIPLAWNTAKGDASLTVMLLTVGGVPPAPGPTRVQVEVSAVLVLSKDAPSRSLTLNWSCQRKPPLSSELDVDAQARTPALAVEEVTPSLLREMAISSWPPLTRYQVSCDPSETSSS